MLLSCSVLPPPRWSMSCYWQVLHDCVAPVLRTVEYVPPDFATTRDPDGAVMRLVAKAEMAKERARMNVFMMSELQELATTVSYAIEQFFTFSSMGHTIYIFSNFWLFIARYNVFDASPLDLTVKREHIRNHMTEIHIIPPFTFDFWRNETGSACLRSSFNQKRQSLTSGRPPRWTFQGGQYQHLL